MKISEILWKAANRYLWAGRGEMHKELFSCAAVEAACRNDYAACNEAMRFLKSLGVRTSSTREFPHPRSNDYTTVQGARYAWLMFASMYAEELGL